MKRMTIRNHMRILGRAAIVAAVLGLLGACNMGFLTPSNDTLTQGSSAETGGAPTPSQPQTGRVTARIPALAPSVAALFGDAEWVGQDGELSAQAYLQTNRLDWVLRWDDGTTSGVVDQGSSALTAAATSLEDGAVELSLSVPEGDYYFLDLEVYNTIADTAVPLTAGTSEVFSVVAGQATTIVIRPVPTNPTSIAVGSSASVDLATETVFDQDAGTFTIGGEAWYSFQATSGLTHISVDPADTSHNGALVALYDSQGTLIEQIRPKDPTEAPPFQNTFGTTSGETYYLGVVAMRVISGGTDTYTPGPFTVSVSETTITPDSYEADDTSTGAKMITSDAATPQDRTLEPGDADVIRLDAVIGAGYTVTTADVESAPATPARMVSIYDDAALSSIVLTASGDAATSITFVAPATPVYIVVEGATDYDVGNYTVAVDSVPVADIQVEDLDTSGVVESGVSVSLGTVLSGTPVEKQIRITNQGDSGSSLAIDAVSISGDTDLSIDAVTMPLSLGAYVDDTTSEVITTLRLQSTASLGSHTAIVNIDNDDWDEGGFSFAVTATVVMPEIELKWGVDPYPVITDGDTTPSPADGTHLGSHLPTAGQYSHGFSLDNVGTAALSGISVSLAGGGPFAVNYAPTQVAPSDAPQYLYVFFDPSLATPGETYTDTVTISSTELPDFSFQVAARALQFDVSSVSSDFDSETLTFQYQFVDREDERADEFVITNVTASSIDVTVTATDVSATRLLRYTTGSQVEDMASGETVTIAAGDTQRIRWYVTAPAADWASPYQAGIVLTSGSSSQEDTVTVEYTEPGVVDVAPDTIIISSAAGTTVTGSFVVESLSGSSQDVIFSSPVGVTMRLYSDAARDAGSLIDTGTMHWGFAWPTGTTVYYEIDVPDPLSPPIRTALTIQSNASIAETDQVSITVYGPGDTYEPNNTEAEAEPITVGEVQNHTLFENDVDWITFDAAANVTYTVTTASAGGTDPDTPLAVFDNTLGTILAEDGSMGFHSLSFTVATAQTVYIATDSILYGTTGTYTITVTQP